MARRLGRFGREGSVSIVMAVCASVLIMAGGIMLDLGWIYLRGRQLQGMADLAAMSAVQDLANGQTAAAATVAANGWPEPVTTQLVTGVYRPDPTVDPSARFQATAVGPSAAQVSLSSAVPLFFGGLVLGGSTLTLVELVKAGTIYMKLPPVLAGKLPGATKPWLRIDLAKIASAADRALALVREPC